MAALPKLVAEVSPTVEAIYAHYQRVHGAEPARPYLGGSIIGKACERALFYDFRWATSKQFDGRLYRLFQTGHREEDRIIKDLIAAGLKVWAVNPATGKQWGWFEPECGNHYAGNADGICTGVIEAPVAAHLLECKTHNTKSFADLKNKGVEASKPVHFSQMQQYMHWSIGEHGKTAGCTRALYVAVCKETDEIYIERIAYDEARASGLVAKAKRVIFAKSIPSRISEDASWFECRLCDHHATCHKDKVPNVSCRTCAHATPEMVPHADGTARWTCAAADCTIPLDVQRTGCEMHRFIPDLLANWAQPIDAIDNDIKYQVKANGLQFWNGETPDGFTSAEIAAVTDKSLLNDAGLMALRETFGAQVAA